MNSKSILIRVLVCITVLGVLLYSYVDQQNAVTRLRLQIPQLAKEIKDLSEKNTQLQYEIDLFESPQNLMCLALHSEFAHLKNPMSQEILRVSEGLALQAHSAEQEEFSSVRYHSPLATGSR